MRVLALYNPIGTYEACGYLFRGQKPVKVDDITFEYLRDQAVFKTKFTEEELRAAFPEDYVEKVEVPEEDPKVPEMDPKVPEEDPKVPEEDPKVPEPSEPVETKKPETKSTASVAERLSKAKSTKKA